MEWIKVFLSHVHDMKLWLENGPIKITKKIIHYVTRYPIMDIIKTIRCQGREEIEANTLAKWNKKGMYISTIKDPKGNGTKFLSI